MLPHAIIVFNATDINVDEKEWDVTKATQMLMTDIHDAILREPALLADAEQGEEKDVGDHKVAWQDTEGRKNGLYEWRCSVDAGKEVTLFTNWDVKAPADVKWIETS